MNLDLGSAAAQLRMKEQAAAAVKGKHLELTFSLFQKFVEAGDDEKVLDMHAEKAIMASSIMFRKVGLLK